MWSWRGSPVGRSCRSCRWNGLGSHLRRLSEDRMPTEFLGMPHRVFGMRHHVFATAHRKVQKPHSLLVERLHELAMPHSFDRMRQPSNVARRSFDTMRRRVFVKRLCVLAMRLPEMKKALRVA